MILITEAAETLPQQPTQKERQAHKEILKRERHIGKRSGKWKFHDLSDESDGLGRRKRTFCNNRLENEILQVYTKLHSFQ